MERDEGLTPNQLVAYNLQRARRLRKWTQEEAAAHLEPFLGVRWSKASWSAAERSVAGDRVRQFSADEVVAFARGFGLSVAFFFMPASPNVAAGLKAPDRTLAFGEALVVAFGESLIEMDEDSALAETLVELSLRMAFASADELAGAQQQVVSHAEQVRLAALSGAIRDVAALYSAVLQFAAVLKKVQADVLEKTESSMAAVEQPIRKEGPDG